MIASIDVYGMQIAWHGMLHTSIIMDFEFVREGIETSRNIMIEEQGATNITRAAPSGN